MTIPHLTETSPIFRSSTSILQIICSLLHPCLNLPSFSARLVFQNIHQDLPDLPLTGLPPIVVVAVAMSVSVETVMVVVVVDESVVVNVATSDSVET
jgi:hypothetical protein